MAMFQTENQFPKRPRLSEPLPNRRTQYKTEPCLRFQRGTYDYGHRCCFVHGNADLRGVDGRHELIGVDEGSRVKYWDEDQNPRCSEKTKLCWKFMNGEKCQFGDRCQFNHIRTERKSVSISVVNVAGNGQMQQHKPTPWKTRLCNRWMSTGSCAFGLKCCFAHGESELQKRGSKETQDYVEDEPCKWVDTTCEKKVDGKQWEFKWKNVEKIGRVYADWIYDMPLVHVETGNVAS